MSNDTRVTKWLRRFLDVQAAEDVGGRPRFHGPAQRRMIRDRRAFERGYHKADAPPGCEINPWWAWAAMSSGRPRRVAASLRLGMKASDADRRTAP